MSHILIFLSQLGLEIVLAMIEARIILGLFVKSFSFNFPPDSKFTLVQRFVYETHEPLITTLQPITQE